MDNELVKDIVGRPRWWLIAVPLMVVFVVVATLLLPDDADSAVALPTARTCPSGEWSCYTADRYAAEFREGRFANSHGVEFTPRVKRMIRNAMSAKGVTSRGNDDWWREPLSFTACIGGLRWHGACRRGQESVNELIADTSRVTVFCSGLAVIGSLAGGGAWGAGKAVSACLWTRLMGLWD
jgi:hypothetical protein